MLDHWYPADFPARLEQLRDLGIPYCDIAATLSQEYGRVLTRNAISGLVHRMKLPRLPQTPRAAGLGASRVRKRYPRRKPSPKQPPPEITVTSPPPPPPPPPLSVGTYSLFDLKSSSCRYPTGDGAPFMFCGETKAYGSYCKEHAKLCCRW